MAVQNKVTASVAGLSRDPGFSDITARIDTRKWSSRRKNIVLKALDEGIIACGDDMGAVIDLISEEYGCYIQTMSSYMGEVLTGNVKEEKVGELIAYTRAWIRIEQSQKMSYFPAVYRRFNMALKNRKRPVRIPAWNMSKSEGVDFLKQYIKDDEVTKERRRDVASKIKNGEVLSFTITST